MDAPPHSVRHINVCSFRDDVTVICYSIPTHVPEGFMRRIYGRLLQRVEARTIERLNGFLEVNLIGHPVSAHTDAMDYSHEAKQLCKRIPRPSVL